MSAALTTAESQTLSDCERIINRGLIGFREVGNALLKIRDGKLYRQEHETFEAYCYARWSMSRPRAYQIMESAGVAQSLPPNLSTIVDKESKARELAKVPPAKRAEVVEVAAAAGPVTAKSIKQAAAKVAQPKPEPKPEAERDPEEQSFGTGAHFDAACDAAVEEERRETVERKGPDPMYQAQKAIAFLEQIDANHPDRDAALDEVQAWISKARN